MLGVEESGQALRSDYKYARVAADIRLLGLIV